MAQIYVKDIENKNIYEVIYVREIDSNNLAYLYNLELITGIDYVNPDENDIQGYIPSERFIDEVQLEQIVAYPLEETLKESLEENGYVIIKKLPYIYK